MPVIGIVGAISIGGSTQVEVYISPQSAAFGRSKFAGAIHYVTADPGEEINGSISLNLSNQGAGVFKRQWRWLNHWKPRILNWCLWRRFSVSG
ncbi:MAG: hypothetical protein KTR16_04110 [Acidiferrobacterales bacterium]|nr:hypothetical protein [Acidiferrobacterales bacterium]